MPGKSYPPRWTCEHAVLLRPFCQWGIDFRHDVTGTLSPDVTGTYDTIGWFDNKPYAKLQTLTYYIWYESNFDHWIISDTPGIAGTAYWESDAGIIGTYQPQGTATGVATVAKGVFP